MSQKIHPAVAAIIAVLVAVVVGYVSFKSCGTPRGIRGKIPASAANPNGGGPPKPISGPRPGSYIPPGSGGGQ